VIALGATVPLYAQVIPLTAMTAPARKWAPLTVMAKPAAGPVGGPTESMAGSGPLEKIAKGGA